MSDAKRAKRAQYAREHRKLNPELYKEKDRERNQRRYNLFREVVDSHKSKSCMDCGVQYPTCVMQFDHRDPKDKKFSIGREGWKYSIQVLLEEIAKCDVVCANCHAIRTYITGPSGLKTPGE